MDNYLPQVYEKYGDQVESKYIEVWEEPEEYVNLLALEQKLGIPEADRGGVPALIIGDKVLIGSLEIPAKLEAYIDEYLAQGGVDYPSLEDLPEVILPTPEPVVQTVCFFDPDHPDTEALNELILSLAQEYGNGLQVYSVNIADERNLAQLKELNKALLPSQPEPRSPEMLIGYQLLVGIDEIREELPDLIAGHIAAGGLTVPSWEDLMAGRPSETPVPTVEPTAATPEPIYLAYFEQGGCQECARTSYALRVAEERYPQLVVESYSIEEPDIKALNEWLSQEYGVPEDKRLSTPMLFVGDDVLIGEEATLNNILASVDKYAQTGAERRWEGFDPAEARESLVERFRSFGVLTVLGAGLIDGLNPCAFATLVFFISYLAFTGRRGRDIIFVGLSFALGVFLTYLLVGVGLLKVVQSLSFFTALGKWVYLITALLCVVLASLTFRDAFKARKGQQTEMALSLPLSLRRRINKVIRESAQVRAFVAMAFVTGFVVSLLELACTGQVYLPTILFVMSVPELAARAFFYLVLYCLMFIVPLVFVFVLSYFGTSSEQLGRFVNRHTAKIKVLTGVLFVGLALWMTWTLAPLFGATSPWNWILLVIVVAVIALGALVLQSVGRPGTQKAPGRKRRSRA
jgi:cytochrome c biogenesis protein CcdA